jgi:hypothetical protein
MKRALLLLGVVGVLAAPAWSQDRTYYGFQLSYRSAPPAPRIYFRQAPQVRYEPRSRVYVVLNVDRYGVDMFRYGRFWYMTRDGYWYRASNYRGPFRVIDPRDVPRGIYSVPVAQWHHHPRGGWRDRDARDRDARDRDAYDARTDRRDYENTYFGFHVDVSNAPAAPRVFFREQPDAMYVPETGAYVVRNSDYDMFRYGDSWYLSQDGYWYRSGSYRGPFVVIDARSVPRSIYDTPDRHWRHRPMRDDDDRRGN